MWWTELARDIVNNLDALVTAIFQTLAQPSPDPLLLASQIEHLLYLQSQLHFYKPHFQRYLAKKRLFAHLSMQVQSNALQFSQKYQYLHRLNEQITSVIQSYPYTVSQQLRGMMTPIDVQPVSLSLDYTNTDFSHLNGYNQHSIQIIESKDSHGAPSDPSPSAQDQSMQDDPQTDKQCSLVSSIPRIPVHYVLGLAKRLATYRIPPYNPFPPQSESPNSIQDINLSYWLRRSPEELLDSIALQDADL